MSNDRPSISTTSVAQAIEAGKLFHIDLNDQKARGGSIRTCDLDPSRSRRCSSW